MDASQDENAAALRRQRLDDGFDLTQRFAGVKLGFDIVLAAQQFQIGDRFEAHHLVAARGIDDEVAGYGEEIGAPGRDVFPILSGIGPCQDFSDHVLKFVVRRQDAPQPTAQSGFLWKDDRLEPLQFRSNPMHVYPLDLSVAPLRLFFDL